jgi:hypothetical protein
MDNYKEAFKIKSNLENLLINFKNSTKYDLREIEMNSKHYNPQQSWNRINTLEYNLEKLTKEYDNMSRKVNKTPALKKTIEMLDKCQSLINEIEEHKNKFAKQISESKIGPSTSLQNIIKKKIHTNPHEYGVEYRLMNNKPTENDTKYNPHEEAIENVLNDSEYNEKGKYLSLGRRGGKTKRKKTKKNKSKRKRNKKYSK